MERGAQRRKNVHSEVVRPTVVYLFSTLSLIHVHETEMSYKDNEQ